MSNAVVRTIVENIVNDKFESLKEDLSKAVSAKAVNVLESKKAMIGKTFFEEKKKINEGFKIGDNVKIHQDLNDTGKIVGSDDHNYHVDVGSKLRRHFVGDPRSNVIHMPKNNIHQLNKYRAGIPRNN